VKLTQKVRENIRTIIAVFIIIGLTLGLFFGLGLILNTDTPLRVVESSSMSVPYNWMSGPPYPLDYFLLTLQHPFEHTLNVGDIIVIQKVDPTTLNTNYPDSDIIVYQRPTDPTNTPIVHRIVSSYEVNGTLYFQTKGDGNPIGDPNAAWPNQVSTENYDSNSIWRTGQGVPQNLVLGKVVMRVPIAGWITLFLQQTTWGLPLIISIILLLIVIEFIVPIIRKKDKLKDS
jgi:signal peptidase I